MSCGPATSCSSRAWSAGVAADDQVVVGPVQTQTRTILDNAGVLLRTVGLSYANVVAARVFLTDDSFFEAMNDEYGRYFSGGPPARATAVTRLMGDDNSVEISLIASVSEKQLIGPTVSPSLPVSTAVRVGPRVFLSGVVGNTDANVGDVVAQTHEALTRIKRTLDLAGMSFVDVVDSTVYLPDLWQYDRMDQVYREAFLTPPARSTIGAKLVTRAGLVEIVADGGQVMIGDRDDRGSYRDDWMHWSPTHRAGASSLPEASTRTLKLIPNAAPWTHDRPQYDTQSYLSSICQ